MRNIGFIVASVGLLGIWGLAVAAEPSPKLGDWPQWRGPQRTGLSSETGLLKSWPENGPPVLWKIDNLGEAYSSLAITGGRIYTQGNLEGQEKIMALNELTGRLVWAVVPQGSSSGYRHKKGNGPRGTPTVDGNRVYAVGGNGDVSCLEAATGRGIWHVQFSALGGSVPKWGYSESPLIDGERVIVTPGGSRGAVAALNKQTGEVVWQSGDVTDRAHYSSAIAADFEGVHQIIQFTSSRLVGLDASNGKLLWSYAHSANGTANVCTPIYAEGFVFSSSAYNTGGGLVKLERNGDGFRAEEVYFEPTMANHHGGIVLVDGTLYGFGSNSLICMDFKTGKVHWKARSVGKGSLCYADGRLYCFGENQEVALVEANPREYVETGRFKLPDSGLPSWAHPVVAAGRLYLRDQGSLTCYDVREPE